MPPYPASKTNPECVRRQNVETLCDNGHRRGPRPTQADPKVHQGGPATSKATVS